MTKKVLEEVSRRGVRAKRTLRSRILGSPSYPIRVAKIDAYTPGDSLPSGSPFVRRTTLR